MYLPVYLARNTILNDLAVNVIPTLPSALLPQGYVAEDLLLLFRRDLFENKLENNERRIIRKFLNQAYLIANNTSLRPLYDFYKPSKREIILTIESFEIAEDNVLYYLPNEFLQPNGFHSVQDVVNVLHRALNGEKDAIVHGLNNVRKYIYDAKKIATFFFTQHEVISFADYNQMKPYLWSLDIIFLPLLSHIEFIQYEFMIPRFRNFFFTLKYKKFFRDLLWVKVREPKIRAKYHPDNLVKMLEQHAHLDEIELDAIMDVW
jgi:hypothetical protein